MFFRKKQNIKHSTIEDIRKTRRLRIYRALVYVMYASLLLAATAGGVQLKRYLLTTPRLALQKLEFSGIDKVTPWDIRVLGDLSTGDNLLTIDLEEAARQIRRHPWVEEVRIRRVLPDRLKISIVEREPAALLAMGALYYVDKKGVVFEKVRPGESLNFPVLTGLEADGPIRKLQIGRQAIREMLALIGEIREKAKLEPEAISEIHIDQELGYSFYAARTSAKIHLGWDKFDVKLARLAHLLEKERLDLAQVRTLDLDLRKWAVVTPI